MVFQPLWTPFIRRWDRAKLRVKIIILIHSMSQEGGISNTETGSHKYTTYCSALVCIQRNTSYSYRSSFGQKASPKTSICFSLKPTVVKSRAPCGAHHPSIYILFPSSLSFCMFLAVVFTVSTFGVIHRGTFNETWRQCAPLNPRSRVLLKCFHAQSTTEMTSR